MLRSFEDPRVTLIVADPRAAFPEYRIELPYYARLTLDIEHDDDAVVRCIVVPSDPECEGETSVNLYAPIVINPVALVARQVEIQHLRNAAHTRWTAPGVEAHAALE